MTHDRSRRETAALLVGNAVGYSGPTSVPFWLTNMAGVFHLSPAVSGLLVTLELLAVATWVVAMSRLVGRISPRVAGLAGLGCAIGGNMVAFLAPGVGVFAMGLILAGSGLGTLLGTVNLLAGRRREPQKVLALMLLALVVFAVVFFFVAPRSVGLLGPASAFAILSGIGMLAIPAIAGLPARLPTTAGFGGAPSSELGTRAIAGGLALLLLLGGQDCFWPFMQQIGARAGLDARATGVVLAIGAVVNLAGPTAARVIGARLGALLPVIVGFLSMMTAAALLGHSTLKSAFVISAISLTTLTFFLVPYVMGLLAELDRSGRLAGAGPALMMVGSAVAPVVAGATVAQVGFTGLSYLTMSVFGTAMLLFCYAARPLVQGVTVGGVADR